jgi:hypothetical protein
MAEMRAEQLCFFRFPRPLLERFGAEFFRNIPKAPGVYLFTDARGRVLYVGQSQNLRERLAYYKNAQPEREPRRIIRLVHQMTGINVECCESVEAARLRELALIGQHRPRFNVANTLSPTYTFFGLRDCEEKFSLRISMKPVRRDGEVIIGAFRNRGLCARAFCAIARTVIAEGTTIKSVFDFPVWLQARATEWPPFAAEYRATIEGLLRGEDAAFIERTTRLAERQNDLFLKQLFEMDLLTLTEFFDLATEMSEARTFHEVSVLSQEGLQVSGHQMRRRRATAQRTAADEGATGLVQMESPLQA